MRTMSGGPCLHYDCPNRNTFGYCKTTVCINEFYQREQWVQSTTNKFESAVIKKQTNADRIRAMTDEELAEWLYDMTTNTLSVLDLGSNRQTKTALGWFNWLKQEVDDEHTD